MPRRLDALLAHTGHGSRKQVRQLIRRGRVTVDGERCTDQGRHVDRAEVRLDGELVRPPPERLDLVMHKPVGYACSHRAAEAPLVEELIPEEFRRAGVESAGRLDRASSGLLILSTDGGFLHRLIHPKRHLPKRYRLSYRGELRRDAVERCARGLQLPDDERPCRPAELQLEGPGRATMILTEGRFHQVRRMIAALGGEVVELHRDRIGELDLPVDLQAGAVREMTAAELAALGVATG